MEVGTAVVSEFHSSRRTDDFDFGFLPSRLTGQCRSLIESYHEVHGYACLPDILWKSHLGPFIEKHRELRQYLRKASTTRSAKKANEGFVRLTTTVLSLEILASSFAGWGAIYPEAGETARAILKRNGRGQNMPLMEFYIYPPKYISAAAIATLTPPLDQAHEAELYRASNPELSGERLALNYASTIQQAWDRRLTDPVAPKTASSIGFQGHQSCEPTPSMTASLVSGKLPGAAEKHH